MSQSPARLSVPLVVLSSLMFASPARADEGAAGRRFAILVGVSEYQAAAELRALPGAANDVTKLREAFVNGGYRPEDVTLMTSREGGKLKPTASNIRAALQDVLGRCKEDDSVVLGFAGHGLQFEGSAEQYFCPSDAVWQKRDTLIPLLQVFDELGKCKAGRKLLMVDACRNDPLSESEGRTQNQKTLSRGFALNVPSGSDFLAVFSCDRGQTSFEDQRLNHGVFFHHVILGLSGAAAGKDDTVTADELVGYVKENVQDYVKKEFDGVQTPLSLGQAGVFPVLKLAGSTEAQKLMNEAVLAAGRKDTDAAIEAYGKALKLDPKNAAAYYERGVLLAKAKKYDDAAADFDRAIRWKPDQTDAYLQRADCNYALSNMKAALRDYDMALEARPDAFEVLADRGFVLNSLQEPDRAMKDLDRAIELNPDYAKGYYYRGAARIAAQQTEEGMKDLDKAVELDPYNLAARNYRLGITVASATPAQVEQRVQQEEARQEQIAAYVPRNDVRTQQQLVTARTAVGGYYDRTGKTEQADRVFSRAEREAERMPELKARMIESKTSRYQDALDRGQTLKANGLANEIRNSLPLNMRKQFDEERKAAQAEAREDKRVNGGGLFAPKEKPEPRGLFAPKEKPEPRQGAEPRQGGLFAPRERPEPAPRGGAGGRPPRGSK